MNVERTDRRGMCTDCHAGNHDRCVSDRCWCARCDELDAASYAEDSRWAVAEWEDARYSAAETTTEEISA
jgi:hypothetical protein